MSNPRQPLPHVDDFLNAYMHQDWRMYGDTLEDVVAVYAQDTSYDDLKALYDEINALLEFGGNWIDTHYRTIYPNSVLPQAWNMTPRQWLAHVANVAQELALSLAADQTMQRGLSP